MSTVLDYQGRRFDLLAFRGHKPLGRALLTQSLFDFECSGEVITGSAKLAQRFTLEFLTEQGSLQYQPERGTEFMIQVRQGFINSEQDAILQFEFAMIDVTQNLITEEEDASLNSIPLPDDERFASAELTQVAILADLLQLYITVTSVAGTARPIILPIKTVPIDTSVV
jgi:hypothetical protein